MLNYFFKKKNRLSGSINFQYVFKNPLKKKTLEISILGRSNLLTYPRLGLSISRRNIKYASHRNTIKRLIRETFRLLQHKLIPMDFIVIAKKDMIDMSHQKLIHTLIHLWTNYFR